MSTGGYGNEETASGLIGHGSPGTNGVGSGKRGNGKAARGNGKEGRGNGKPNGNGRMGGMIWFLSNLSSFFSTL